MRQRQTLKVRIGRPNNILDKLECHSRDARCQLAGAQTRHFPSERLKHDIEYALDHLTECLASHLDVGAAFGELSQFLLRKILSLVPKGPRNLPHKHFAEFLVREGSVPHFEQQDFKDVLD